MFRRLFPLSGTARILAVATFVDAFGNGTYLPVSVLFLTRSVGLTAAQVGFGLTAAAFVAFLLSTPLGYVADRYGPKATQITMLLLLAAAYTSLVFVHDMWTYLPVASAIATFDAGSRTANGAMIAGAAPPDQRVRVRAYLRSVANAGVGLGTLAGAAPLVLNNRTAYVIVILGDALTFLVTAAIMSRATPVRRVTARVGPRLVALRDRPFLAFALVDGLVNNIYLGILGIAMPLWIVTHTHVPPWIISVLLAVNTIGCVVLQVWSSRRVTDPRSASLIARRGCLVLGGSCVLFGVTVGLPTWLAVGILVAAAVVHLMGELWESSASWGLVFLLAREDAQGQYQGTAIMGRQLGAIVGPAMLTTVVVGLGTPGWILLAAVLCACGCSTPAIVRWALASRQSVLEPQPA